MDTHIAFLINMHTKVKTAQVEKQTQFLRNLLDAVIIFLAPFLLNTAFQFKLGTAILIPTVTDAPQHVALYIPRFVNIEQQLESTKHTQQTEKSKRNTQN